MRYSVYIIYRRENGGMEMATMLQRELKRQYAISAFLDISDLEDGRFDKQLEDKIKNCDKVILVLPPNALERCGEKNDWVRTEIEWAEGYGKTIIPVYKKGDLSWRDKDKLPESLHGLGDYNGVEYSDFYPDATIKKLAGYIGKRRHFFYHWLYGDRNGRRTGIAVVCCMLAMICGLTWLAGHGHDSYQASSFDEEFHDHLIMNLENASHRYTEGLYNWKRLDYKRAERDILSAHEELSRQIPQSDVEMAKINNSLGCLYLDMGKYEKAYDYLNSARVTFRKTYGEKGLEVRAVQYSIAQYDYYTGDFATALKTCEEILDVTDVDKDKTVVTTVKHLKAKILDERGEWKTALDVYQEVLDLYSDIENENGLVKELTEYVYGSELNEGERDYYVNASKWVALTYNAMGRVYLHMGNNNEARRIFDQSLTLCRNNVYIGDKSLITAESYRNLAIVYGKRLEIKRGLDCIDRAMRIPLNMFESEEGQQYSGLVETYEVYGDLMHLAGDDAQAVSYYEKACELAIDSYTENHPQTAAAYNVFGMYYYDISDYETADSYFEKAIEIRKNILGVDYVSTAIYYVNLARAKAACDHMPEAMVALETAREICENLGMENEVIDKIVQLTEEVPNL